MTADTTLPAIIQEEVNAPEWSTFRDCGEFWPKPRPPPLAGPCWELQG